MRRRRNGGTGEVFHERVAAHVRAGMAWHQVTQVEAAAMLGITQQSVSARLRGLTPFTLDDLDILARRFGVTPAELVAGITHRDPPTSPKVTSADTLRPANFTPFLRVA